MKPYYALSCENLQEIQEEVKEFLRQITNNFSDYSMFDAVHLKTSGWMYLDKETCLKINALPLFSKWLKQNRFYPRLYSIIVVDKKIPPVTPHTDLEGTMASVNFPVLNNTDWYNRWYEDNKIVAEYHLTQPLVFNHFIEHDVTYKGDAIIFPRITLSMTLIDNKKIEGYIK